MKAVRVNIISKEEEFIGTYNIYPAQQPVPIGYPVSWTEQNPKVYQSDSRYPGKVIEVIHNGAMSGARLVKIAVYPLQYDPKTRELYLIKELRFDFILTPTTNPLVIPRVQSYETYNRYMELLRSIVKNQKDISSYLQRPRLVSESELFQMGDDYRSAVIVTSEPLDTVCWRLANWLTEAGVGCGVWNIEYIREHFQGRDDAEKLRHFLYWQHLDGTYYVFLVGDDEIVPFRYCTPINECIPPGDTVPDPTHWNIPCDLYFSDLNDLSTGWNKNNNEWWGEPADSPDVYPEVMVGRMLVRNRLEADGFVTKIIRYEYEHSECPACFSRALWEYASQNGIDPHQVMTHYPDRFEHYEYTDAADVARQLLDVGYGNVSIYTHGCVTSYCMYWDSTPGHPNNRTVHTYYSGSENYYHGGLNYMTNYSRPYWVYSVACDNAAFDKVLANTDTCIADAFTDAYRNNEYPVGSVALLGNTRFGWMNRSGDWGSSFALHAEFLDYLFAHTTCLGEAEAFSKVGIWNPYPYDRYVCYSHNLIGSPELQVFTKVPRSFKVSCYPSQIPVDRTITFEVIVKDALTGNPVEGVRVCIRSPLNNIFDVKWTNTSGVVDFTVYADAPDWMSVACYYPKRENTNQYYFWKNYIPIGESKSLAGIDKSKVSPKVLSIVQLNPTIADRRVIIKYGIPEKKKVKLCVYNSLGVLVKTLYQGNLKPAYYDITWNLKDKRGKPLSSGVYWIVLSQGGERDIKKLLILR